MANLDLNKLFAKKFTVNSEVDSDINLNRPIKDEIVYSDVKLDLSFKGSKDTSLNPQDDIKDLNLLINEESVLNSLRNILSTTYCSRLLNPEMDFDLRRYLFETVNETKAYFIGYHISTNLPVYEPRIQVENIHVVAYPNQDAYGINLSVSIPSINKSVKLRSILNSDGFVL